MSGCKDCPESGPSVDNTELECDEFVSTDCILTSEANSCFKYGIGASLTDVLKKVCKKWKDHETRISDLEANGVEGCCNDADIISVAGSQLNLNLYVGDLKDTLVQQTYTTDYTIDRFNYRVQVNSNLLRVEYSYRISVTAASLDNFNSIYVIGAHDISNINTYLQTNYNKVVSAPNAEPFYKPASVFVTPAQETVNHTFSTYNNLTPITGVNEDQIVDIFKLDSLNDESATMQVGATLFLPIEDI